MRRLIILFLLPVQLAFSQTSMLTLEECYRLARANYPKLSDAERQQQISELRTMNIGTSWKPQFNLQGQASYQSDVTSIHIPTTAGFTVPLLDKDQYKVYVDVRQNIYDGGLSRSNRELEKAGLAAELQNIEVELYSLNDRINQLFFGILLMNESKNVLNLKLSTLDERLKVLESGLKNGMVTARDVDLLQAEKMLTLQQVREIEAERLAGLGSLQILTGVPVDGNSILAEPELNTINENIFRPELKLYDLLGEKIDYNSALLQKMRNPKVYGFGQAGYGRPGLDMLKSTFDTYYLVGVGLSWNILDWKQTVRNRQMLEIQKQMVSSSRETFNQGLNISIFRANENIRKAESLLQTDENLLGLRSKIAKQSASQLENGTITSSDYIVDLNGEMQAQINKKSHKIQLLQAIANYNTLTGNQIK
jgi:outer membrane protein TolC